MPNSLKNLYRAFLYGFLYSFIYFVIHQMLEMNSFGFLTFSGGIEIEHRAKMGQ